MAYTLKKALEKHAFLEGLAPHHRSLLLDHAHERIFNKGAYLKRQGDPADEIYLISSGKVALEISMPQDGAVCIEALQEGDVLGWSCLVTPYQWRFDARALTNVTILAIDSRGLYRHCEDDPEFGYAILSRCTRVIVHRLEATQLKVLELFTAQNC